MNLSKCKGPARQMVVLGHLYDAALQLVRLPDDKQTKYLAAIRALLLRRSDSTCRDIQKVLGYLGFSSYTEPFGRPFLSALDRNLIHDAPSSPISLSR